MFVAFAFAAAVAAVPSNTCKQLAKEFEQNERMFAFSHDLDASLLSIEEDASRRMEAADHELAMAQARARAVGVYVPRPESGTDHLDKVRQAREKVEATDSKFKSEGDRLTILLIANKCPPPDHVTSWFTYSDKNPNRREPGQATAGE